MPFFKIRQLLPTTIANLKGFFSLRSAPRARRATRTCRRSCTCRRGGSTTCATTTPWSTSPTTARADHQQRHLVRGAVPDREPAPASAAQLGHRNDGAARACRLVRLSSAARRATCARARRADRRVGGGAQRRIAQGAAANRRPRCAALRRPGQRRAAPRRHAAFSVAARRHLRGHLSRPASSSSRRRRSLRVGEGPRAALGQGGLRGARFSLPRRGAARRAPPVRRRPAGATERSSRPRVPDLYRRRGCATCSRGCMRSPAACSRGRTCAAPWARPTSAWSSMGATSVSRTGASRGSAPTCACTTRAGTSRSSATKRAQASCASPASCRAMRDAAMRMSVEARALDVGFFGALWEEIGDVARQLDARVEVQGSRTCRGRAGWARSTVALPLRGDKFAPLPGRLVCASTATRDADAPSFARRRRHARGHRTRAARRHPADRSCRCRRAPTLRGRLRLGQCALRRRLRAAGDRTDGIFHGQLELSARHHPAARPRRPRRDPAHRRAGRRALRRRARATQRRRRPAGKGASSPRASTGRSAAQP